MLYVPWQEQRNICDYLWRKRDCVQYTFYNHCAVITTVVIH